MVEFPARLQELVSDEGVAELAPTLRLSGQNRSAPIAERLEAQRRRMQTVLAPHVVMAPTDDDIAILRAIVRPTAGEASRSI
jgi:hypothetical protein